jgi:Cd2+/Zn2+-exporting ATPase
VVIATPVTVVSGLAAAARRGILIKGGVYLEEARKLRAIALDKTGTITEGKPRLVATEYLPSPLLRLRCAPGPRPWPGTPTIRSPRRSRADSTFPRMALDFTAVPGRGIEARTDGERLTLGNHRLIEERGLCSKEIETRLETTNPRGAA